MSTEVGRCDIAIVGAGMVGLTLAAALADSELSIKVIDSRALDDQYTALAGEADARFDPRVSALTPASENILRRVGVWPAMAALRVSPYRAMQVWDGEGTAAIRFDCAELHRPHLGHIVENRVTVAALQQRAAVLPNVELMGGLTLGQLDTMLSPDDGALRQVLQLSDGSQLQARLLVAADGARSRTRALTGLGVSEWDYEQHAVVTTLVLEQSHQATAWQRFTEDGPLALLPLPTLSDGLQRVSLVWSTSPQRARELLALDNAAFCQAITMACEQRLGSITHTDARYSFPLTQRHAARYVKDGVALVGDAAHSIHPLAGQGVNLGLLDAATLAEEILDAQQRGIDFSARAWLRRYQRRRQGENLAMIGLMGGLKHLYGTVPPALQWLRNWGLDQVAGQLPLRQWLAARATGIGSAAPALARDPI
ncbi:MAG TPA: UbiH/UbiF/VisC/COQ6 family ubiquinone biosynthesis hydroxylase [Motiliproteus sp.]